MADNVQHPKHYNREGALEAIDEMILIFGKEAVKNFCLCNAWKYRYRATDKNGEEDLHKSDWYIRKYKELCEEDCKKCEDKSNIISVPNYSKPQIITISPQPQVDSPIYCTNTQYTTTGYMGNIN